MTGTRPGAYQRVFATAVGVRTDGPEGAHPRTPCIRCGRMVQRGGLPASRTMCRDCRGVDPNFGRVDSQGNVISEKDLIERVARVDSTGRRIPKKGYLMADARQRVSMRSLGVPAGQAFRVDKAEDGTITMTPVTVEEAE